MATPFANSLPAASMPPAAHGGVWLNNGRLVSRTIDEPDIKQAIEKKFAELARNPEALHDLLVERGFITPTGKLPKRYGG